MLTVQKAYEKLEKLVRDGYGDAALLLRDTRSGVTDEISNISGVSVWEDGDWDPEECMEYILENEDEYVLLFVG